MYYLQCWNEQIVAKNFKKWLLKIRHRYTSRLWKLNNKERNRKAQSKREKELRKEGFFKQKRSNNLEKARLLDKLGRERNKDKIKERQKSWRTKNPNYKKEYRKRTNKTYYKPSTEDSRAKRRERDKNRHKTDSKFALLSNASRTARGLFTKTGAKNTNRFVYYFGCDFNWLKLHIEKHFVDGMTWENRGKVWHVDHILPKIWANDINEFIMLNHWSNLRPLFIVDNLRKKDSPPDFIPKDYPYWQHFLDRF
jgi:hypothetical protein